MTTIVRNAKWTFSMQIATHTLVVDHPNGKINVLKIEIIDDGKKCKIVCSGRIVGAPGWQQNSNRSHVFNVSGWEQHPNTPDNLLEFVREHAFPRQEL